MRLSLRRPLPFLVFVLLLTAGSSSFNAQTPSSFRITGVVVNSISGNPIARCHLEANLSGRQIRRSPRAVAAVDADEHGRFTLVLPSAGSWNLLASAPGYVRQSYDAHGNYSSSVVLTVSSPSFDLRFQLPPEGRISGTVIDEAGEAIRNASVELLVQPLPGPVSRPDAPFPRRSIVQTDDRGAYEFAGLLPAKYQVAVQARPWYASAAQSRQTLFRADPASPRPAVPEPSLDVTYQHVWYPGVADPSQAETISLAPGEERHADFHLNPIPSLHLQIFPPVPAEQNGQRLIPSFPIVERIDGGGSRGLTQTVTSTGTQGAVDIGGLTPGTYRVTMQGQGQPARSTIVQMAEGSSRSVDLRQPAAGLANVIVQIDGDADDDQSIMVELVDTATRQIFSPIGTGRPMPLDARGSRSTVPRLEALPSGREIALLVPPGRYEVVPQLRGDAFLTGISARGADLQGRFITLHDGDTTLTLHTASGRASVGGIATVKGKPCAGAIVLLIPAGLDAPGSLTAPSRDQSNTDGSFSLENLVPGQYILIAVDRGWNVNWSDPTTLRRYLTQGIPLDLGRSKSVRQDIEAQLP